MHLTFIFLLKSTTWKLQYCMLLGFESKTEEGRLSSDKVFKIMALTATSPSPQILFVYIPGFNPFSVGVWSLLQCGYSPPAQIFAKRWALTPSIFHVSWVQVPPLRCNACIALQLPKVYTGICLQEEDVADRLHTLTQYDCRILLLCRYSLRQRKQSMPIWEKKFEYDLVL